MKSNTSNVVSLTKAPLFLIFLLCSMYSSGFELDFGVKSLGPYVEVGHKFSDSFNIRAGISGYDYSYSENADSSDVPLYNHDVSGRFCVTGYTATFTAY